MAGLAKQGRRVQWRDGWDPSRVKLGFARIQAERAPRTTLRGYPYDRPANSRQHPIPQLGKDAGFISERARHRKSGALAHAWGSSDAVSLLPEKCYCARKTENSPGKLQFNDRPHPYAPQRWRLFHDGHVASSVGDVDQVAAGIDARGEEYGLAKERLVSKRQAGN